jgi:hypothetical protein
MSMTSHPVWFKDDSGKWSQINGVIEIVVATPLVARGTYRDKPPPLPAAGGGVITAKDTSTDTALEPASMQIIGGVTPTVSTTVDAGLDSALVTVSSPSSLEEDDDCTHEPLRDVFGPEPVIFFKTAVTGSPDSPDASSFSTDRPAVPTVAALSSGGFFPIFAGDCFFPWTENCGVTNTPPQGWEVFTGA